MKKLTLCAVVSAATLMMSQAAMADRVKGTAKADFENGELLVPCVLIEGTGSEFDGKYFDLVMLRRGKSFNYELTIAEPEDGPTCAELDNYATFIDDDDEEEDDDDLDDDSDDDDSDDEDSDEDDDEDSDESADDDSDDADEVNLFASCEVRHEAGEQTRSKAKVKAKNLAAEDYYAVLTSGDNTIQSETRPISGDEIEIEFDSDADDVLEGAEAIEPGFIINGTVTGELFNADTDALVFGESVSCLVKN